MFISLFTLFVALLLSGASAYYSIIGLMAIFSGAQIPIMIMGSILELAKITTAVWLHFNWRRAPLRYKLYLVPATITLMLITSLGAFGFLSKSHSDQGLASGDVSAKIAIIDERIRVHKENIESARGVLAQMDSQVNQRMSRSDDERAVERSVAIRRQQASERQTLQKEINKAQIEIAKLNEERAPIAGQLRVVEADVGPIKYIAAMVYGDNPDTNLLERAVRWVIIIIVLVFDPLAIMLILSGSLSLEWDLEKRRKDRTHNEPESISPPQLDPVVSAPEPTSESHPTEIEDRPTKLSESSKILGDVGRTGHRLFGRAVQVGQQPEPTPEPVVPEPTPEPVVPEPTPEPVVPEPTPEPVVPEPTPEPPVTRIPEARPAFHNHVPIPPEAIPNHQLVADNNGPNNIQTTFGTVFPKTPGVGDLFLRVDVSPNRLFKWDGIKWIEVDKNNNDNLAYNELYISYLIDKIESGEYEIEDLSELEKEQIEKYLRDKKL
jgi:hypothetical protein